MKFINKIKNTVLAWSLLIQLLILVIWNFVLADFYRLSYAILLLSLFTLILLAIKNKKQIRYFFVEQLKENSLNSFISVLMIIGIVVSVNYIAHRNEYRLDLTRNKLNTLSEQTIKVLNNLENDVHYMAFIERATQAPYFRRVMDMYRYHSDRISYEIIDPNREPVKARANNVTRYGTIIASMGDKETRTEFMTEEAITNAIIKLNRKEEKKIYFLYGHMERDIDSADPESYSGIRDMILNQGYLVEKLNIVRKGRAPQDAGLIIIANPKRAFFKEEVKIINDYIRSGGPLIILSDPTLPDESIGPEANVNKVLSDFGIRLNNDVIIDPSARLFGLTEAMPVIQDYSYMSPITAGFNEPSIFPFSQSIDSSNVDRDSYNLYELCRTSESSWGEVDAKSGIVSFDEGVDRKGPLVLCAKLVEEKEGGTNLVVFGNSSFISNQYISHAANSDLFLNAVSYLLEDDELIAIRPRMDEAGSISMPANTAFAVVTVYFIPFFVLLFGIIYWYRRRRK